MKYSKVGLDSSQVYLYTHCSYWRHYGGVKGVGFLFVEFDSVHVHTENKKIKKVYIQLHILVSK